MATVRVERRLAAILAADVVGYSRLTERDEAGTFARLKRLRRELIEPVLARHGGRFVDLKGDGAIVEFQSAVEAVEAAVEIQQAMLDQDPELPEAERIRYRVGINLGDVIVDGESIFGDGVNVAARIESLCEPGGVWLSRSVYNQVKGKIELALVPSGLHQVKNISEAVETFRVALDGVAPPAPLAKPNAPAGRWFLPATGAAFAAALAVGLWWFWPGEPRSVSGRPGIAVLPFENLGGDEPTGRLADGITEDIITDLARFRDLDVIARNSTGVYKGKAVDVRQVGKELKVATSSKGRSSARAPTSE
jgi:class 3 adenylate cyclase